MQQKDKLLFSPKVTIFVVAGLCQSHVFLTVNNHVVDLINKRGGNQLEFTSTIPQGAIFGIANVKSKNCSRTIGYLLGESELTLLLPKTCLECPKASSCGKEFGRQAVNKYNQNNRDGEIQLHFWDE